ncbi:MAG: DUF3168 domain-containing protein [Rhodobacteraceae bacterium]|jgi:hypothetical protein|uniref:DUF3168 domain-containing protein n=1 Tax=Thioclava marina TaxID=1915077 RepID=A0ABX3MM86_9RHOB|nr:MULTISPECIES: DUF3168 domain-containing protein [Thioclava]OOY12614.1 hypothetical protein BMG00_01825 [Thioclava marina]OOY28631.1 hypothetical protein BMI90_08220 [Thioclava sp. L04-15]TNE83630.1 MAG: DUF3168 domain-containing protein [Paracoccaceae bacterium]TNF13516.1 MAG: DUF3168 domain-containing protein [Paracoccaceae bacterium]
MSYAIGAALQAAVYARLQDDPGVTGLVGSAVYDAAPAGTVSGTYVSLGPEDARDASDMTGDGAVHDFTVSVVSDVAGFQLAKQVGEAISDTLLASPLTLARGRLVGLWFLKAKARRVDKGAARRLDLTFRARVEA